MNETQLVLEIFAAFLNTFQAVALAYIAVRWGRPNDRH